jgi:hypothetical protein
MKQLIFITILSLVCLVFAGCGDATKNSAANTNSANNKTVAADNKNDSVSKTSLPETSSAENAPTSDLKPSDIDPNKPVPVADLKAAYIADKTAWNGKEVSVTGNYFGKGKTSSSGKVTSQYVSISDSSKKMMGTCYVSKEVADDISANPENHVFKGTIKADAKTIIEQVVLDPCEVVK